MVFNRRAFRSQWRRRAQRLKRSRVGFRRRRTAMRIMRRRTPIRRVPLLGQRPIRVVLKSTDTTLTVTTNTPETVNHDFTLSTDISGPFQELLQHYVNTFRQFKVVAIKSVYKPAYESLAVQQTDTNEGKTQADTGYCWTFPITSLQALEFFHIGSPSSPDEASLASIPGGKKWNLNVGTTRTFKPHVVDMSIGQSYTTLTPTLAKLKPSPWLDVKTYTTSYLFNPITHYGGSTVIFNNDLVNSVTFHHWYEVTLLFRGRALFNQSSVSNQQ